MILLSSIVVLIALKSNFRSLVQYVQYYYIFIALCFAFHLAAEIVIGGTDSSERGIDPMIDD